MLYIAQVKRECYGHANNEDAKQSKCPADEEATIVEALKFYSIAQDRLQPYVVVPTLLSFFEYIQ